jgi:hypothetical protein
MPNIDGLDAEHGIRVGKGGKNEVSTGILALGEEEGGLGCFTENQE